MHGLKHIRITGYSEGVRRDVGHGEGRSIFYSLRLTDLSYLSMFENQFDKKTQEITTISFLHDNKNWVSDHSAFNGFLE